jgi:hypothetical protein
VGMPVTEAQLHALKPFEFQNWVINRMNGTHSPRKWGTWASTDSASCSTSPSR